MKRLIKEWIPPAIVHAYRGLRSDVIQFQGDFQTWESACAASSGYDSEAIFQKTRVAALKVKKGEAAFERDSVVFDHVEFCFPVLAGLLRAACARDGNLRVLDFGGGLGTTYRQFKAFEAPLQSLSWSIVEQPKFVEAGRAEFANEELRFFSSIAETLGGGAPDVVLLSSVLQYVELPYHLIREVCSIGSRSVVIARTPSAIAPSDTLTVQVVPPSIYEASYPCWILAKAKLLAAFSEQHRLVASFEEPGGPWRSEQGLFKFCGFVFDRNSFSHAG